MKIIRAIAIILLSILIINTVYACNVIPDDSPFSDKLSCDDCDNNAPICNCQFDNSISIDTNTQLYSLECSNYKINIYTNGYDLSLNNDFNFYNPHNNVYLIIDQATNIWIYDDSTNITLPNITVLEDKILNIKKLSDIQKDDINHNIKIDSILVKANATLKFLVSTNPGKSTIATAIAGEYDVKTAGDSGDLNLEIKSIENFGDIILDFNTGNGGIGADGDGTDNADFFLWDNDSPDFGDNGGNSGNLYFNIKEIKNYKTLNISLKTGAGGKGGNSVLDETVGGAIEDSLKGGQGKSAGNINIERIDKIINIGEFKLDIVAGNGGNGGSKRSDNISDNCDAGQNGNGGDGGSISDINIGILDNKLKYGPTHQVPKFELNVKSGALGKVNLVSDSCNSGDVTKETSFGIPGSIGNINIDFLNNDSENDFIINSHLNFTAEDFALASSAASNDSGDDGSNNGGDMLPIEDLKENIKLSNININHLNNGSYLPKNISTNTDLSNEKYFYNEININGCYINPTSVDYTVNGFKHISATNDKILSNNYLFSTLKFDLKYNYCPHCEIMPLDDTQNRYTRDYSLYSNTFGTINIGDLNIYYSNPSDQNKYYTKRTDDKKLPVYTNKNPIQGVLNTKINSYEYKIKPEDLNYYSYTPEDDIDLLNQEDNLFCYGQEYIINGKITDGATKPFNFPFVPLRELFTE